MSFFDNPIFQDAEAAREWLEALLWPEGPICPHCGLIDAAYKLKGKTQRKGLYKCKGCEEQFTVTVGTVFERSHVPLNKWIFTFQLMAASKKGVSAHQVHRMLGVTYKTAWFMCHRIREALTSSSVFSKLGGENKVVEIDETYVGGKEANKHFSILKRGIIGTYHHVSEAHLHRYLAEFDFRYNERAGLGVNDAERVEKMARAYANLDEIHKPPHEARAAQLDPSRIVEVTDPHTGEIGFVQN